MRKSSLPLGALLLALAAWTLSGCSNMCGCGTDQPNDYAQWKNGPSSDSDFFPIAVWLQDPADAAQYKAAGINTYVGLWEGPTEEQLAALTQAKMPVICEQNAVALKHINDPIIVGWMHGDEPDNAQSSPGKDAAGKPLPNQPIPPQNVIAEYEKYRKIDPTRPIMLNLGQGVSNDDWKGRAKDNGNFEPYKMYVKSGDIISYDVYPVSGNGIRNRGDLALEARGIDRLKQWTGGRKIIWNCIECTQINGDRPDKITPEQMQSCVWISLIHGSTGLIYFCHQFQTGQSPKHLLLDEKMLAAVTAVNKDIKDLAVILNSPSASGVASVKPGSMNDKIGGVAPFSYIDLMTKKVNGDVYIFAADMTRNGTHAKFHVNGLPATATAEVSGESRKINIVNGNFEDEFTPFAVHRYVIGAAP